MPPRIRLLIVLAAVLRMPSASTAYVSGPKDSDTLWNEAVAAYVAAGNPSPTVVYDTVAMYFANIGYSWARLATVGGQRLWLNGSSNAGVITHELGHNYGLMHASSWDVTSSNPVDPAGASTEYGDSFDVMGSSGSGGHFHTAAKQFLGWLDAADWTDITNAAQNATYRLYRFDTATRPEPPLLPPAYPAALELLGKTIRTNGTLFHAVRRKPYSQPVFPRSSRPCRVPVQVGFAQPSKSGIKPTSRGAEKPVSRTHFTVSQRNTPLTSSSAGSKVQAVNLIFANVEQPT